MSTILKTPKARIPVSDGAGILTIGDQIVLDFKSGTSLQAEIVGFPFEHAPLKPTDFLVDALLVPTLVEIRKQAPKRPDDLHDLSPAQKAARYDEIRKVLWREDGCDFAPARHPDGNSLREDGDLRSYVAPWKPAQVAAVKEMAILNEWYQTANLPTEMLFREKTVAGAAVRYVKDLEAENRSLKKRMDVAKNILS